ncbi:MAG: two-component system, OmpR family, sensor kinase [Actinomycetota bacterium]|nr:two-component system, OmpR family, sensor kinase [Actinomycetota bacterium]
MDAPSQQAVAAAFAVFAFAVAALAGVRYRGTKDPATLFVSVAFLTLAVNAAVFGMWWPRRNLDPGLSGTLVDPLGPVTAWIGGWLIAALSLLLTRPWWDRRGRPAIRPTLVVGAASVLTALIDVIAIAAHPDVRPSGPIQHVGYPTPSGNASVKGPGWVLVVLALIALGVAGVRLIRQRRGGSAMLAAASFVAALGLLSTARKSTFATGWFEWVDVWPMLVAALAFTALLVDLRVDTSRMRRATDRARAVMGGRAEIASMLGHEVKGPVATIRGLAGTTITHYDRLSDTERQEFLSLIEQESRKLLTTVDQASLGMKVDARTLSFVTHPTELAVVVRDVVDGFDAGEHQLTFDAPEPAATATVDRKWLAEAVRQVLLNAATFSPPRSPIRIVVRQMDRNTAAVDIIDAGPGIPRDQWETVFQKFAPWRPEGYEEAAGTGLGLFIARGIVRAHGGDVRFADRPSGGTMLSIQLPTGRPMEGTE